MSLNIDFPDFNHPEVRVFYEYDLSIPKEKVEAILQLPRETLIEDMETMIMETIDRDKYFRDMDDEDHWWSFHFHALWVLTELKATEALPTLLKLLKQDNDYSWFWWGDHTTEGLWEAYYHLGNNKLDELKEALLAPEGNWVFRIIPSTVAEQVYLYQPERQQEILDWYDSVLDDFLAMEDENDALDGEVVSSVMVNLIHIQADKLLPKIKALFEKGYVYDGIVGDMESVRADIKNPKYGRIHKRELPQSIYDRYEDAMTWASYQQKYNKDYGKKRRSTYSSGASLLPPSISTSTSETVRREGEKIGRNDPCPCGSGKKYKKCHMNK